jgi:hypothetical protein
LSSIRSAAELWIFTGFFTARNFSYGKFFCDGDIGVQSEALSKFLKSKASL